MGLNITHDRLQHDCYMWFHNTHTSLRLNMWMNHNNPKNKAHGAILKGMGLTSGVFDLLFYYKSVLHIFEIKIDGDYLKKDQLKWAEVILANGGKMYEIRSLEKFKEVIEKILK